MVEVNAGLFLGSEDDAYEVVYGKRHRAVTHILSITSSPPSWLLNKPEEAELEKEGLSEEQARGDLKTLHVQADDRPCTDLLVHFEKCCLFIQQGLDHSSVLVHCAFGISRSTTVVLAYLMKKEGRRLDLVIENVRQQKPDISPNAGFLGQLKLWGAMGCRLDPNYKHYKAYRLQHLSVAHSQPAAEKTASAGGVEVERYPLAVDPAVQEVESTAYYRCRKCRRLLFTEDSVLQHELGEGLAAFNPYQYVAQKPATCGDESNQPGGVCTSYFIELMEWMDNIVRSGDVTGKVLCPKCEGKLGSYNWSGQQCSCGHWVTPSFQVHKVRIDEVRSLAKRKT